MESTIFFTTSPNKYYMYDFNHNTILLSHPLIEYYYCQDQEQNGKCTCVKNDKHNQGHSYSESEHDYYSRKYKLYKDNNYFGEINDNRIIKSINSTMVDKQLDNISQIVFEVTDGCNLKCKYCAYGELYANYDKREDSFMSFKSAKLIIDYFVDRWNKSRSNDPRMIYVSFYGGEPLLNMQLIQQVVKYVEDVFPSNIKYVFTMTTNAVLLNRHIDYLVDKDFKILVSLDGNSENNSYRVTRAGKNSFDVIFNNLIHLKELYPDFFKSNINFNAVLHNRNSPDGVLNFIQSEFDKIPNLAEINNNGVASEKKDAFDKIYKNIYESLSLAPNREAVEKSYFMQLPKIKSLAIFANNYSDNHFGSFNSFFHEEKKIKKMTSGTCLPFGKKIFITVNGKLLPCERIGHDNPLGHYNEKAGVCIDTLEISNFYNQFYEKVSGQCSECYLFKTCMKCMYYFNSINKPVCDDFLDKNGFRNYLKKHIQILEQHPEIYEKLCAEYEVG